MGYTAKWKALEDLVLELKKNGFDVPSNLISELRSAKLMINIAGTEGSEGESTIKLDEVLGSLESELITAAQNVLPPESVDMWLKRFGEAGSAAGEKALVVEEKLITGVPRDQKWVRAEPSGSLTVEKIMQMAKEGRTVKPQQDNRMVVYGSRSHQRFHQKNDSGSNEKTSRIKNHVQNRISFLNLKIISFAKKYGMLPKKSGVDEVR